MNKISALSNKTNKYMNSFNIILADKDLETFKRVQKLNSKFNFINLSSSFAVSFILEYEKIDLIIISKKISNIENILERAKRKKINVYILGKDIKLPINKKELENIIFKEAKNKVLRESKRRFSLKKFFSYLLGLNNIKKTILGSTNGLEEKIECNLNRESREDDNKCKKVSYEKITKNKILSEGIKKINDEENINSTDFSLLSSDKKFENDIACGQENSYSCKSIKTIKQKIIILSKAKGGVGSTTISIFLGYMFTKVKTLLVDLNFSEGGGDIGYYLDIPRSPNILNFIEGYNRDSLDNSVIKIKKNLDILQTPPTYEMSKKIDLQDIYCLADIAKKKYHLIIFDLPNRFDDLLLGVIDLADLLIMVSDYTLGSVSRLISISNKFLYDDLEKILILNKFQKVNELNLIKNQIEQFFNLKDFVFLEEDKILRQKSDFTNFNFNNLRSFSRLTDKVFNLLTCD